MNSLAHRVWRKCIAWAACVGFGAAYGAAFGAIIGGLMWRTIALRAYMLANAGAQPWPPMPQGVSAVLPGVLAAAVWGALGGAILGGLTGIFGLSIARPGGWILSAMLVPFVVFGLLIGSSDSLSSLALLVGPTAIGGFLGLALTRGMQTGRSSVPGVRNLAAIIGAVSLPERSGGPSPVPLEITPATAPEGCGDEAAPAA